MTDHLMLQPDMARQLQTCIHCGLCLSSCPTYMVTAREADSPRGRLVLMNSVDRQPWPDLSGHFVHIDRCLGCLACQTACPSGVPYGDLLEEVRKFQRREVTPLKRASSAVLKWSTVPALRQRLTSFLRWIQTLRLDRLAIRLRLLPRPIRLQLAGLPKLPAKSFSAEQEQQFQPCHPDGVRRQTVALLAGCVMDSWFADVHAATVRVLRWNGYGVVVPAEQQCCGALHAHAGIDISGDDQVGDMTSFSHLGAEAVIVNAAGCGAHLKHAPKAEGMPPIYDVAEWLVRGGLVEPAQKISDTVTYDAPCHLYHGQNVVHEPEELLRVSCEQLVPLPESDVCCGSAGLYSLSEPDLSWQILRRKLDLLKKVDAKVVATANPGCQMQLQGGLILDGQRRQVRHTIEILDQAYSQDEAYRQAFAP